MQCHIVVTEVAQLFDSRENLSRRDKGRVVEVASHDELVSQGERYARLWESWRAGVITGYG